MRPCSRPVPRTICCTAPAPSGCPRGEGYIDLAAILNALPPDVPLGLEVPMLDMAAHQGAPAVLRRAHDAARRFLAGVPGAGQ